VFVTAQLLIICIDPFSWETPDSLDIFLIYSVETEKEGKGFSRWVKKGDGMMKGN
jgi:hypothetical protein